jgi:membrane-bound lytic murein transglycosylase F
MCEKPAMREIRGFAAIALLFAIGCKEEPSGKIAAVAPVKTSSAAKKPAAVEIVEAPSYVLTGDLKEIQQKGMLRLIVPAGLDALPRGHDPRLVERELAAEVAGRLGLKPVIVPVEDRAQLLSELEAGHGDMVVAAMTITDERSREAAFTRPIRTVKQVVVVKVGDDSIKSVEDLAGKEVTVRASSAYATTLKSLSAKVAGLTVKNAAESEDTIDLIQKVARGEEKITVADSDILAVALTFEPNVKAAVDLTEKDPIAWAVRKSSTELKAALDTLLVEKALTSHQDDAYKADLDEIKKRKVLRVLTRNAASCFFIYRGEQLGFEYELAKSFAKELDVRLEIIVPPTREALISYLLEGKGDLIAAGLTITPERQKLVDFTDPYFQNSELVIVPASDTTTKELKDLKGKKISVRKSSSYYENLAKRQKELGFQIDVVPEDVETEEILRQVGEGKLAATIADSNIVDIELTYSDKIRSVGPLGDPATLGWAMRTDQPALRSFANEFMKKTYRGMFYNMTVTKYFKNAKNMRTAASEQRSDKEGQLSPFDAIVKKYAKQYELDWRLVTSQMYQESKFDPGAKSWVGALGLMQVMPQTAKELKIEDVVSPEGGIHAGVKLLARYAKLFDSPTIKEKHKIRFALAAYNCGPGHVFDARRVAKDQGLDPDKWFGNVEKAMLMLENPKLAKSARYGFCRCSEPVKYVSEIQTRYDAYSKLVPMD